jgi:glycosyltransferase involved in cell wall biosynthesis
MANKRVLFIGLNKSAPPFIEQRIALLSRLGLKLTVLYNGRLSNTDSTSIEYISKKPLSLMSTLPIWLFRFLKLVPWLWSWKKKHGYGLKQWIKELNGIISILQAQDIAVIHAQWFLKVSMLDLLEKAFPTVPLMVSARGSQVSVYPLTITGWPEVLKANFSKAGMIHCVSEDIKKHCLQLGASESKLWVNYNGIRTDFFRPVSPELRPADDTLKLISVGAIIWRKGYIYQLLLLKELNKKGIKANLTIIGDGPDIQGLKYTAQALGLSDQISWLGKQSLSKVLDALHLADIYVSTSIAEGLPNSVAEAAACGLPIIAFECEGLKELLPVDQHPYIVPFSDIAALAQACEALISLEKRAFLSKVISEHIKSHFNAEVHASKMIERYQQLQYA